MTKHSHDCKMAFGRKDPNCPRCQELLKGAAPRKGWNISNRRDEEARRICDIKNHDCEKSHCGPVCTYGDW